MKKVVKTILVIIIVLSSIFLLDFIFVKLIDRPIFMIKKDNIYYGLGYKYVSCDNNMVLISYTSKYNCKINKGEVSLLDSVKFKSEYSNVDKDNVFVYRTIDEIISILNNGTGIIYLGFPECKWCQAYVSYLNDVAKELDLEKIYYFNILEDRKNNTEEYLKIVEIIKEYLNYDEEGKKRIYVPTVIAVKEGKIVGFDDETSLDTKELDDPKEYWTNEEVKDLKEKLTKMIKEVNTITCTECNK